ncbi:MAG: VanZ family protein [Burkholderiaceae bacterium]|nr:VanZ family protein [Burkholderiaceae bacterium]
MTGVSPDDGGAHRSARRLLVALWVGYLAFVVYGSLVPLNFVPMPWDAALRQFAQLPYYRLGIQSRADWVANGLLFMPLTYIGAALMPAHWSVYRRALAGALLWAGASALSVAIEFTQLFFPGRTVGLNDIIAESIGAALGLLLFSATGRRVIGWLQGWWRREVQSARLLRALHLYLAGLLFYAVMPLDLTISPVELLHKMSRGAGITLVPFSDWPREAAPLAYKAATDLLLWLPVGLMWRLSGVPPSRAAARGLGAAAFIELLQLFVYSRHSSVTDIVTAALGAWTGTWLATALAPRLGVASGATAVGPAQPTLRPIGSAHGVWLAWFAWLALALTVFWYPFDFHTDVGFVRERLRGLDRPLLTSYYMGSEFRALTELLRKVLMFLPGGFVWALAMRRTPAAGKALLVLGLVAPVLAALTVEGGQLMLPDKVADFSDVLFESAGGWVGLLVGRWLLGAEPVAPAPAAAGATSALPLPASHRGVALPRYARASPAWRVAARSTWIATWPQDLLAMSLLATALVVVGRHAAMPYNVRELFDGGAGIVAAAVVVLTLWSLWVLPLVLLERWAAQPEAALWLLPGLPLAAALPALLMAFGVPEESLGDIVGAPVLGWPGAIEQVLRYAALHGAVLLAAIGAAWSVVRLASPMRFELLPRWLVLLVLWAAPLHAVIVVWAATDNLVELMREGGSWLASVLLFGGLMALFTAAFAVSAALNGLGRPGRRSARLLAVAALAWPAATALLWLGSETELTKYDKTFSAAQFLLSVDRDHYAPAAVLCWRFLLASTGLALAAALLQAPRWRRLARLLRASMAAAPP